jgi:hypothetical protein
MVRRRVDLRPVNEVWGGPFTMRSALSTAGGGLARLSNDHFRLTRAETDPDSRRIAAMVSLAITSEKTTF